MQLDTRCPTVPTISTDFYFKTDQLNQPGNLTDTFFSPQNIKFLVDSIGQALSLLTKEQVRISPNDEFMQTMFDMAGRNVGLSHTNESIAYLNRAVIDHETNVQLMSLRQRKLFYKYFWYQDRMKVFPYGQSDHVTKGEVTVSTSGYALSNPWRRWQADYLKATAGLIPTAEANKLANTNIPLTKPGYCRIDGYLQPKVRVQRAGSCKAQLMNPNSPNSFEPIKAKRPAQPPQNRKF